MSGFKYDLKMKFDIKFEYRDNKSVLIYTEDIAKNRMDSEFVYDFVP